MNITKRRNLLALSIASLGILGAFTSVSASSIHMTMRKGNHSQTRSAIQQAIAKNDYQAFLLATKDKPSTAPTITEVQFKVLVEADKLRTAGKHTEALDLIKSSGITLPMGGKLGKVERGGGTPKVAFLATLTDAQKSVMAQAHTLRQAGKNAEADVLIKNAGITLPAHSARGNHMGKMFKSVKTTS